MIFDDLILCVRAIYIILGLFTAKQNQNDKLQSYYYLSPLSTIVPNLKGRPYIFLLKIERTGNRNLVALSMYFGFQKVFFLVVDFPRKWGTYVKNRVS